MCLSIFVKKFNRKNKLNNDQQIYSTSHDETYKNCHNSQTTEPSNKCFIFLKRVFCCKKKKSIVNNNPAQVELLPKSHLNCSLFISSSETSQNDQFEVQQKVTISNDNKSGQPLNIVSCSYAEELCQLGIIPYQQSEREKTTNPSNENIRKVLQNFTSGCNLGYFNEKVLIANGVRSSVFYAKDSRINGKSIALKQILLTPREHQSAIEEVRFLFNKQIQHENLLKATECFTICSPGRQELYISIEYIDGGCLRQLLTTKLTEIQMATVVKEVLRGLAYMHSHGYFHMNLTSENILLGTDGFVKLTGFSNIAKKNADIYDVNVVRTIFYVAPEVAHCILNKSEIFISGKIDIWALGVIVAEMIDNKPLFYNKILQCGSEEDILLMIATCKNPRPSFIDCYSSEMNNFVSLCLDSNELSRATTNVLREHQFVQKADTPSLLIPNIQQVRNIYQLF